MTALTVYPNSTNDTLVTTARQLATTAPAAETSTTTKIAKATGWGNLFPQGSTATWSAGASAPAAGANGAFFILDSTLLEAQDLAAGNFVPVIKISCSSAVTATILCHIAVRHSDGTFTTVGTSTQASPTVFSAGTAQVLTLPTITTGAPISLVVGDKLVVDFDANITVATNSTTATFSLFMNGGANESISTPGYAATPLATVSKAIQALWTEDSTVDKSAQDLWTTLQKTTDTISVTYWNLISIAQQSPQALWNDLASISLSRQDLWNITGSITKNSQEIWGDLAPTSVSRQELWNATGRIVQSSQEVWNDLSAISQSRQELWNILSTVSTSRGATEDFSAGFPADILTASGQGIGTATILVTSDYGNPTPSLRSDGSGGGGGWWYFNGSRFQVTGDFDISYDLNINPDGTATRDIANFAFWVTPGATPATTANGFLFRLQTGSTDGGFMKITNGSHSGLSGATFTGSLAGAGSVNAVAPATWYRVRLQAVGTVVSVTITRLSDSSVQLSGSINLGGAMDGLHTTSGTFGQKQDGAGSTIGHRWDNISIGVGSGGTTVLWNSLQSAAKATQELWNDTGIVTKSSQDIWNELLVTAQSRQELWNITGSISKTSQEVWNDLSGLAQSRQELWSVIGRVLQSRQELWNTLSPVAQARQELWNITGSVNKQTQEVWNALAVASVAKQELWNASSRITTLKQLIWSGLAPVSNSRQELWIDRQVITQSRQELWGSRMVVSNSGQELWVALAPISKADQLRWAVTGSATVSNQILWNLRGLSNISAWNGSSWVTATLRVWNGTIWAVYPVKRWNGSSWI